MNEGNYDKFRDEIIILGKAIRDLHKWKLIVVGTICTIAFGLSSHANPVLYVLIGIPFTVNYIDALIWEYEIRVGLIANFVKKNQEQGEYRKYETFLSKKKETTKWTNWPERIIVVSSICSCCISLFGMFFTIVGKSSSFEFNFDTIDPFRLVIIGISIVGIFFNVQLHRNYKKKYSGIWEE